MRSFLVKSCVLGILLLASMGHADTKHWLIGPSIPAADQTSGARFEKEAPTRHSGGEAFQWIFLDHPSCQTHDLKHENRVISRVRLTSYSTSGLGKILVRRASVAKENVAGAVIDLKPFITVDQGAKPPDAKSLTMLSAGQYVEFSTNTPWTTDILNFVVEGYSNNDASVAAEAFFDDIKPPALLCSTVSRDIVNPPTPPPSTGGSGGSNNGGSGGGSSNSMFQCHSQADCPLFQSCYYTSAYSRCVASSGGSEGASCTSGLDCQSGSCSINGTCQN